MGTETARYFGSLCSEHGRVVGISDCNCADCIELDLWETGRRYELKVLRDSDGGLTTLRHVRNGSFTGWRS